MAFLTTKLRFKFYFKLLLFICFFPSLTYGASLEQIKMAFVFNLANYVTWPDASFKNSKSPFLICLDANQELHSLLDLTVKGEKIKDREIIVLSSSIEKTTEHCHIFYISKERNKKTPIVSEKTSSATLWVSDLNGFASLGGMIEIKKMDQHLKLFINLTAVKKKGLSIRSNLLNLSTIVE